MSVAETELTSNGQHEAIGKSLSSANNSFELRQRQAMIYATSPLVPEHLRKDGPKVALANCYIAMEMAELLNESPLVVMQNIFIVKGKAGWSASYMIGRANKSGKFRGPIQWSQAGQGDGLSVTAFSTLASTGERVEFTVSMAMAKADGWAANAKYKSLPELMLRYRAATLLIRLYAPEVMLGYHTREEIDDIVASEATTPARGIAGVKAALGIAQAIEASELPPDAEPEGEATEAAEAVASKPATKTPLDIKEFRKLIDGCKTADEMDGVYADHFAPGSPFTFTDDERRTCLEYKAVAESKV